MSMLSPEIVMQELSPLFPSIYSALDFGAGKAKEFLKSKKIRRAKILTYILLHIWCDIMR